MESSTGSQEDTRDLQLSFTEAYRELPVLRDVSSKEYSNKEMKNAAYDELLVVLKEIKKNATRNDIKKKINSLRTNYRKELKKINVSKRLGADEIYKPTCWTFRELSFLNTSEGFVSSSVSSVLGSEQIS